MVIDSVPEVKSSRPILGSGSAFAPKSIFTSRMPSGPEEGFAFIQSFPSVTVSLQSAPDITRSLQPVIPAAPTSIISAFPPSESYTSNTGCPTVTWLVHDEAVMTKASRKMICLYIFICYFSDSSTGRLSW